MWLNLAKENYYDIYKLIIDNHKVQIKTKNDQIFFTELIRIKKTSDLN